MMRLRWSRTSLSSSSTAFKLLLVALREHQLASPRLGRAVQSRSYVGQAINERFQFKQSEAGASADVDWHDFSSTDQLVQHSSPDSEQRSRFVRRHEQRPELTKADRRGFTSCFHAHQTGWKSENRRIEHVEAYTESMSCSRRTGHARAKCES